MPPRASLRFLSLFVPNLDEAARTYQLLLGTAPSDHPSPAPAGHPFAVRGPVVFQLGEVALALYQCDGRTTHPGDVGIGIETILDEAVAVIRSQGGLVVSGPQVLGGQDGRGFAVGVVKDRHFFEMVEAQTPTRETPTRETPTRETPTRETPTRDRLASTDDAQEHDGP